jgi:hypothetical protein
MTAVKRKKNEKVYVGRGIEISFTMGVAKCVVAARLEEL